MLMQISFFFGTDGSLQLVEEQEMEVGLWEFPIAILLWA